METQFKYLSLGTRFSDPELLGKIYVKLSSSTAIEFHKDEPVVCFNKSSIVGIWPDFNVMIRETYTEKTNHQFPKTVHQEAIESYYSYGGYNNPYEEGTSAHKEFEEAWHDADWDDCE